MFYLFYLLIGPGGAAVATSELDPLPVSDISAAFASLAPLSARPSSLHPRLSVCPSVRPWTGRDPGGRGTETRKERSRRGDEGKESWIHSDVTLLKCPCLLSFIPLTLLLRLWRIKGAVGG